MFNGPEFKTAQDFKRLNKQHERIKSLMLDGKWRTLSEIAMATNEPIASISAQLRHLRKERFGSWCVDRRSRGDRAGGLFEYRVSASVRDTKNKKPKRIKCEHCAGTGYAQEER